jgi:hypothetical protein
LLLLLLQVSVLRMVLLLFGPPVSFEFCLNST